jgi:ribosomal subunit interface protein
VDIVVKGRHTEVSDRFRRHAAEKLAKVEKHDHRVIRIDVEVSTERNPRQSDQRERIELTVVSKGPVVRAEARADDPYAALDIALGRLEARLRRASDRRRVHHGGKTPRSLAAASAVLPEAASPLLSTPLPTSSDAAVADEVGTPGGEPVEDPYGSGDGPMLLREKEHAATPMTLDQALYEMELVGHDFFLFVDKDSARPSVVYRRRGYDYGVIRLVLDADS